MRPRFVLFGDSITQFSFTDGGWGAALAHHYARKADVLLRGYGGYNTRWALFLLDKIFPQGTADAPLVCTIFFGANDAALNDRNCQRQHVPLAEYKENLLKIISHIQAVSKSTHIVLITPPPVDEEAFDETVRRVFGAKPTDPSSRTNGVTGTYAKACVEVAKEAGVSVVELWAHMQDNPGWKTSYLSDGLHLSAGGNAVVFEKLLQVLDGVGLSFDAMAWDFPEHLDVNAEEPWKTSW